MPRRKRPQAPDPLAASTLIIAANIPDLDGACYLHSADLAFAFRRGWTHGVLAVALLPVVLTAAMLAVDRVLSRRARPRRQPARPLVLLALAALGVLSHPFLDWLNNYGVRLLMPFSDRWFYGDTLFIVDPWLWLILGGAVMLAWTTHTRGLMTAAALGLGTTALMLIAPLVPEWARAVWMAGSPSGRWPGPAWPNRAGRSSRRARWRWPASTSPRCSPARGSPSTRCVNWPGARMGRRAGGGDACPRRTAPPDGDRRVGRPVLFVPSTGSTGPAPGIEPTVFERGAADPAVDAALAAPFVQGVRRWLRFPSYEVLPLRTAGGE